MPSFCGFLWISELYHRFDDNFARHLNVSALVWYVGIIVSYCNIRRNFGIFHLIALYTFTYHLNQNCNLTLELQNTFNSWLFNNSFQSSERTFKVILAPQHSIKEKFLELETKTFQKDLTKTDQWRYHCENSCFQCT